MAEKYKIFLFISSLLLVAGFFHIAAAQGMPQGANDDFFVEFSPENPGANTKVNAQTQSYSFDINRASVSWTLNGKVSGTGKSFSFTTGNIGSLTSVGVSILSPAGQRFSKSFFFQAADVDLLWETSSYIPPQYQGKALPISGSKIKITAIPWGMEIADSKLIYEWNLNNKNILDQSGTGKKTITITTSDLGNDKDVIKLKVSTPSADISAEKTISIKINEPKILFYEESPLEGPLYQKALNGSFSLQNPELSIRAEPYFFSRGTLSSLIKKWAINSKEVEISKKPNIINLSIQEKTKGTSLVKLSLTNPINIYEFAQKLIQINFEF